MLKRVHKIAVCIYLFSLTATLLAQSTDKSFYFRQETGLPYIQNFDPKDYRGNPQNWAICQDAQGVMYFGNGHGIYIFDGVSWEIVSTTNKTTVRSLCYLNNTIYVGARNELGYLDTTENGKLIYKSFLEEIPADKHNFKDVWQTVAANNAVYFRTTKYIFRWAAGKMQIWEPTERFHTAFSVNDTFYVRQWGIGLMRMQGDSLVLLPGGEQFASDRVYAMMSYDDKHILLHSVTQGLFLFDGTQFIPFQTEAKRFLAENQTYFGLKLSDDLFAFATRIGGVAILDKTGKLYQIIDKTTGLRDQNIRSLYKDREGGLWLAMNNGIARVETPSPVSIFSEDSGINSTIESVIRHKNRIYLATHLGVYSLDENESSPKKIKKVSNISTQTWCFLELGDRLLVGSNRGIHEIKNTKSNLLSDETFVVNALQRSKKDSNLIFLGLGNGFALLKLNKEENERIERIEQITAYVMGMAEDSAGVLWLGSNSSGVFRIDKASDPGVAKIKQFTNEHGLPDRRISAFEINDRIHFVSNEGLRYYNKTTGMFESDSTFGEVFADTSCWIFRMRQDKNKNIWLIGNNRRLNKRLVGCLVEQPDGSYDWQGMPFSRVNNIGILFDIYPDENGIVWLSGSEGLARLNPAIPYSYNVEYDALVRNVQNVSADTVYFYNNFLRKPPNASLDYKYNSLRFQFAAPSFNDVNSNQFRFKLEGYDKNWSKWTSETKKDYTGLAAGSYKFRVQAKNIYDQESNEGTFDIRILAPWYQKWWAYILYGFFTLVLFGLAGKARVQHLQRKNRELETIISERTATISAQAEKLLEADELKSRFFANISHEFRTPLTLILGPLEDLIGKTKNIDSKEALTLIQRNAHRVLGLINQLLDLSRLESGKMMLNAKKENIVEFLKSLVMAFASLAEQKNIELKFEFCESRSGRYSQNWHEIYFDSDKIEKIFFNLLSNALKFTQPGGKITVSVFPASSREESETSPPQRSARRARGVNNLNFTQISVKDTGIGIPSGQLPHVFARFFQVDGSSTREQSGSGIGLSLTRELVELHKGKIEVRSEVGKGSEFIVWLPTGRAHLSEEEIIPESEPSEKIAPEALIPEVGLSSESESLPARIEASQNENIILIVDDHADVRRYIRKTLTDNYNIVEAHNGADGLEKATDLIPDLVISDVMMPQMNGYEFCAALKTNEKTSHIPVILLTARAGEEDKLTGLETGADDYLTKPFSSKEMLVRLSNLIEQRRKLRQRFMREGGLMELNEVSVTSADKAFMEKLMAIIEENLEEEEFGVERLSEGMNIGRRQIHRKISALTNLSPTVFIRTVRLQRARQLLEHEAGTVSEIAFQTGFSSLSYFSKAFQKQFGMLPSEVRK